MAFPGHSIQFLPKANAGFTALSAGLGRIGSGMSRATFDFEIVNYIVYYAPNFEKVDGAYCFWSVGGWVRHTFCTYCNF